MSDDAREVQQRVQAGDHAIILQIGGDATNIALGQRGAELLEPLKNYMDFFLSC
ncbi:MAG: hypothetical protein HQM03_08980 [Magnetococcales bacterium]|nr:hypothetical protein [Magnetococcales bacterium]